MIKLWAPHWGAPRGNMCAAPAAPTAQLPAFVDSPHHEPSTYQVSTDAQLWLSFMDAPHVLLVTWLLALSLPASA